MTGNNSGSCPASRRPGSYRVDTFAYAAIEAGRIVERVQQRDIVSQTYSGIAKRAGLLAGGLLAASLAVGAAGRLARRHQLGRSLED